MLHQSAIVCLKCSVSRGCLTIITRSAPVVRLVHTSHPNMQDTRPPGHRQRRLDHLKLMNYTMEVDEDKVEARVHTNGLNYTDFDSKNATPKPWQLMKFLESSRFFSHHWPLDDSGRTFRDYADVTSNILTFLVTSQMDMQKGLYLADSPKSPLDVIVQGGYIGNTSLNSITTVINKKGEELFSNVNQVVLVDKATRRPSPIPDWWKQKYAKSAEKHSSLKFDKFEKPDDIQPFRIHVVRSDLDGNNHTNWSCYVRFATDAIYHFAKKGVIGSFCDVDKRGMRRMELYYSGESFDDDVLNAYVWEHTDAPESSLRVHIYKESKLLFQGQFLYFENLKP